MCLVLSAGESGSAKKEFSEEVKPAFYAVTTSISEEERTRFLLVVWF